jgi:hypothetical protein
MTLSGVWQAHRPAYENLATKTYSSPNAFPSALRRKRALVQNKVDDAEAAKEKDPIVSLARGAAWINTPSGPGATYDQRTRLWCLMWGRMANVAGAGEVSEMWQHRTELQAHAASVGR